MSEPRRVNFELHVFGTTDRDPFEWAEGVARYLQSHLNDVMRDLEDPRFPPDVTVDVTDAGEGG